MRTIVGICAVLILGTFSACATYSKKGARVRLVKDPSPVCQRMKGLSVPKSFFDSETNAKIELSNKAAEIEANQITDFQYFGASFSAVALKCPTFTYRSMQEIENLCTEGQAEACVHIASEIYEKSGTQLRRKIKLLNEGCKMGSQVGCDLLAEAKKQRTIELRNSPESHWNTDDDVDSKAIALKISKTSKLQDSCKKKSAKSCLDLLNKDDTSIESPSEIRERISIAERACMYGSSTGCELMKIYLSQEANDATIAAANRQAAAAEEAAETASRAERRAIIEGISNSFVRKPSGSRTTCEKNWTGQVECETRDSY